MRRNVSTAATPAIFLGPNDRFGRSSRSWSSDFDEESLEETLRKAQEMIDVRDPPPRPLYGSVEIPARGGVPSTQRATVTA